MTEPILELRHLTKIYSDQISVDDLSLSLPKGEFLSFLGPSGSGKTTTLNMIAGLTEPTRGDIFLKSKPITALKPYQRNIGVVFQNYSLFPHMSVAKNVAFPLEMRKVARLDIKRRVSQKLELVGLHGLNDRLPSQLSGGQQQRVALARAMVFEPPLLLMDEPLGALDKKMREHMQIEIRRLHQKISTTIIYVTHDQDEALTMSDRIAVFNKGKVEQIGTPAELYNSPTTRFVASFIGETNLVDGRVSDVNGTYCRVAAEGFEFVVEARPGIHKGTSVTVALRPERIHVGADGLGTAADHNAASGKIEEVIFSGSSRRYVVSVGGTRLSASQAISAGGDEPFSISQVVPIHWSPRCGTILPL